MKAVILAGGLGTRLAEETHLRPKPMVEIGGKPIIWHIMKMLSTHGITEFVICCGYKGYMIKEFFVNYFLHMNDITVNTRSNDLTIHKQNAEDWKVTLVDTGELSNTGGRLLRVQDYLNEKFLFTYGDGVSDVNISSLISFHEENNLQATVTAVQPPGRYGALCFEDNKVSNFQEKPEGDGGWVSGGFFILEKSIFSLIKDDSTIWENEPLEKLASAGQLGAYKHFGFWQPMDTLRDKQKLEGYGNQEMLLGGIGND